MSGESPDEQLHGGDVNPGFGAGDRSLEILGQAAVSIEPSEGSFDDPSPWEQLKACRVSGAFDDFDGPVAELDEGLAQVRAIINAVGEEAWPHRDLGHRRGAPQRWSSAAPWQRLTLRQTRRTVPIMFSMMLVQASERRSSAGGPRRMTVRVSSRPSRMLAATPGARCSSLRARFLISRSAWSASSSSHA